MYSLGEFHRCRKHIRLKMILKRMNLRDDKISFTSLENGKRKTQHKNSSVEEKKRRKDGKDLHYFLLFMAFCSKKVIELA